VLNTIQFNFSKNLILLRNVSANVEFVEFNKKYLSFNFFEQLRKLRSHS
jgi:hypothetical protein